MFNFIIKFKFNLKHIYIYIYIKIIKCKIMRSAYVTQYYEVN